MDNHKHTGGQPRTTLGYLTSTPNVGGNYSGFQFWPSAVDEVRASVYLERPRRGKA